MRFIEKIALVTGGASGIGAALAQRLRQEGATVIIADLAEPQATTAESETNKLNWTEMDVRSEASVAAALQYVVTRWGRIDVVANCAGIGRSSSVLDTTLASWNDVIAVNLTGTFLVCRDSANCMIRSGGGAIVNIASVDAHAADPNFASYNSSKAAILGLTRSFAIELAESNIRVNSVSPGLVLTPMVTAGSAAHPHVRQHLETNFKRVPMRRVLQPTEVAAACAYLLSDDASAITGTDLIVDGGMLADSFLMRSLPTN